MPANDDVDVDAILKECEEAADAAASTTTTKTADNDDDDDNVVRVAEVNPNLAKVDASGRKLLSSLQLLATDVDGKLGLSTKVQQIDDKFAVQQKTSQALQKIKEKTSSLDQTFQVSATASAVNQNPKVVEWKGKVGNFLQQTGTKLQQFDDKHDISTKTANLVSSTVDFLSNKIQTGMTTQTTTTSPPPATDTTTTSTTTGTGGSPAIADSEEFPSSFQK